MGDTLVTNEFILFFNKAFLVFGNVYLLAGLRDKYCQYPIAVVGVVDTFGKRIDTGILSSFWYRKDAI